MTKPAPARPSLALFLSLFVMFLQQGLQQIYIATTETRNSRDFLHLLKVFGRGEPLVLKLAIISEYIIVPGALFVALIYSPENDPIKHKGNHTLGGRGKMMGGRRGKWSCYMYYV
ncbi:hypothetical protein MRB53_017865 [Persea americana]|uniref:Uncharacterized protein n=1 Tax=Persea americana TaxID=3435 RepID=A0ACC2M5T8_PERAE|nr:hypothetical protein MRB53_017865 [Persea americana]